MVHAVTILACAAAQPSCNGKKANAYEHVKSSTKVGEKRTPSNEDAAFVTSAGYMLSDIVTCATSVAAIVVVFLLTM